MAFDGVYNGRQVLDSNGDPVSNARIYFYRHGTVILQNVWANAALSTLATNPVIADAAGYYDAFLSPSLDYDVVIKSADDSITYSTEAHSSSTYGGGSSGDGGGGDGGGSSDSAYAIVDTVAEVQALTGTDGEDMVQLVAAGREGLFVWSTEDESANITADTEQGIYIAPDSDNTGASGAWVRRFSGPVSVSWYGALGDSSTDDTAAFQAALDSGHDVHIPGLRGGNYYAVDTVLTCGTAGQRISGDGDRSEIRQSGSDANANVFYVNGVEGVQFRDLYVRPGTTITSTYHGFAFYFTTGSHRGKVFNCLVTDHRRGGIMFVGSNYCEAAFNTMKDSVVNPATDNSSQAGVDIWLVNGCNNCNIHDNISRAGAGTGVSIQAIVDSVNDHNVIADNNISEAYAYGIYVYVGDADWEVDHNVITGNVIDTVYGSVESASTSNYTFGCGIYVQGAEHTTVVGNSVQNTCIDTDTETLTPACIGMTNCRSALIANNTCTDSTWYGIMIVHSNDNATFDDAVTIVEGNRVYNATLDGIYAKNLEKFNINDNTVISPGARGIRVNNASVTQIDHVSIGNNYIADTGNAGIEVVDAKFMNVSNNMCMDCGTRGIVYDRCLGGVSVGNLIERSDQIGIYYIACSNIAATGDVVYDAGQGVANQIGFALNSSTYISFANCIARNVNGSTMLEAINFIGGANQYLHFTACQFEGASSDVAGSAPPNIRWDGCIADRDTTMWRKNRTISANALSVTRYDQYLHVTGGGGTTLLNTISTTDAYQGQVLYLTFADNVNIQHAFSNIYCDNDTTINAGPSGASRVRRVTVTLHGSNWLASAGA